MAEITIPGSCKTIGNNAFQLCPNLSKVTLGEGVETLNEGAFRECAKLTEINLPASLKTIGQYAFLNDVMLSSVRIPVGVTEIGNAAFSNVGVTAFEVETGNTACQAINGVCIRQRKYSLGVSSKCDSHRIHDCRRLLGCRRRSIRSYHSSKVIVPEGMRAFDDNAFSESSLTEINFSRIFGIIR